MDASGVKDEDNSKLTVNIRSDETVGKRNTYVLTIYYVPILAVFLVVPILFWRRTIRRKNALSHIIVIRRMSIGDIFVSFCYKG